MEPKQPNWPPWPTSVDQALRDYGHDPRTFPRGSGLSQAEAHAIKGALEVIVRQGWPEEERRRAEAIDHVMAKLFPVELPPHPRRGERGKFGK